MASHLLSRIPLQECCSQPLSGLRSRAMETLCPVISTRGPHCLATGRSQFLGRLYPQRWTHAKQLHLSCVALPGQSFRHPPSWRMGRISLLGGQRLGYRNQRSVTSHRELRTCRATAARHRMFPQNCSSIHPFLLLPLASSGFACNPQHPCQSAHAAAAIACTRHYASGTKLPPPQSHQSGYQSYWRSANRSTLTYMVAIATAVVGLAYAAVPLYRLFCQASGYGGTVIRVDPGEKVEKMQPIVERELTIRFNADTSAGMRWQFKPDQKEIKLVPGETALAFYTARNPTDEAVTGIAMYNVIPFEAGQYFNKIQCFCFEEQRLNPREQVDMPVFFYIDPEFNEDPSMARVDTITLSYTFFQAKEAEGLNLPLPGQSL